jgi:hypothetical protein
MVSRIALLQWLGSTYVAGTVMKLKTCFSDNVLRSKLVTDLDVGIASLLKLVSAATPITIAPIQEVFSAFFFNLLGSDSPQLAA